MPRISAGKDRPFSGLRLDIDSSFLEPTECESCQNIDLSKGTIRAREGMKRSSYVSEVDSPLGMVFYEKRDSTEDRYLLIKHGTVVKSYHSSDGSSLPSEVGSSTGYDATTLCSFAEVNNRVYLADGTKFQVSDGVDFHDVAIGAPSAPTVNASAGDFALSGAYQYAVSYYSTTWGVESARSSSATVVNSSGGPFQALITLPSDASGDSRVDRLRVYRKRSSETVFTLYTETSSFGSVINDDGFTPTSLTRTAPPTTNLTPDISFLEQQAGTMFGVEKFSNKIFYTAPLGNVWAGFLQTQNDNEAITGIAAYNGIIFIFKEDSIWTLSGNDESNFHLALAFQGVGCRSHFSIVHRRGQIYFLGRDGIYQFDGASEPENISWPIGPLVRGRIIEQDHLAVGGVDLSKDIMFWAFTEDEALTNEVLVVYFPENSARVRRPSWAQWSVGREVRCTANAKSMWDDDETDSFLLGADDGEIYRYGGTEDSGSFLFRWRTGKLDGGVPTKKKKWGQFTAEFIEQGMPEGVSMFYLIDNESSVGLPGEGGLDSIYRTRIGRSSRDIRIQFQGGINEEDAEITYFSIDARLSGRDT